MIIDVKGTYVPQYESPLVREGVNDLQRTENALVDDTEKEHGLPLGYALLVIADVIKGQADENRDDQGRKESGYQDVLPPPCLLKAPQEKDIVLLAPWDQIPVGKKQRANKVTNRSVCSF